MIRMPDSKGWRRLLILWLLPVIVAPPAWGATPVRLIFHETVTVPGPRVRLGEIAEIETPDGVLAEDLRSLEVALAPPPNHPRDIRAVTAARRAAMVRPGLAPVVDGAATVRVWVEFVTVTPEQIEHEVRLHLAGLLDMDAEDQEIHLDLPQRPIFAAAQTLDVRVIDQKIGRLRDRFMLHVGIFSHDVLVQRVNVPVSIRTFGTVVRLRRSVSRNTVIQKADVELLREETTTLKRDALQRLEDVVGMRTKRSLPRGRLVFADQVEAPPLVPKGATVTLEARIGNVRITATGTAQEDGNVGDIIEILNLATGTTQRGRIVQDHLVVLQ